MIKTSRNLLFACEDNLNNFLVVVASFPKVSVFSENDPSTRRYHYNNIVFQIFPLWRQFSKVIVFNKNAHSFLSFPCRCKVKTQRKVCGFDENDMKTCSRRQGLSFIHISLHYSHQRLPIQSEVIMPVYRDPVVRQ